ncbi:MAG: cation:proton antiporter [Nanoarchaeota archaeon]|nr:cation:proton antiporter [Nanoarchaeota archaeon]
MVSDLFSQLSIIIALALVVSIITSILKQPLIIGYIITGILISPHFLNIVSLENNILALSKLGVVFLLFMVGLNLNPKIIKEVGKVALITGILQIIITSSIVFLISKILSFTTIQSIYIAIALTFSSTIIIMKLLTDKGEINTLPGKISIGILIIQDLLAIALLMIISSLSEKNNLVSFALEVLLKGTGLIIVLFLIGIYFLPKLTKKIAKSQELLLLFSIAWCLSIASIFYYFHFSIEVGALIAGITLSLSPYRFEISSRLRPLRDFFLLMFFILLGSQMIFTNIESLLAPIIIFSIIILILNPLITIFLMSLQGYRKRNSFLTGINLTHISEFSFILLSMALSLGHIQKEILSLVTIIALITMAGSSYLVLYSNKAYSLLSPFLSVFERKRKKIDEGKYHQDEEYDVILLGYNRIGFDLLESLKKLNKRFLVVDYNPDTIKQLIKQGIDCRYGDAGDSELLDDLNISNSKMIISTIPEIDTNILIIRKIRSINKKAIIIAISHQIDEALRLYEEGAAYVIMPHFLGGQFTSRLIEEYNFNSEKFLKERNAHIQKLKSRKKKGQEHPKHERG